MKKLSFLVGCLLLLGSSPILAQTDPDIAIVRFDFGARKVIITKAEGKSEVTDFSIRLGVEKSSIDSNEVYYTTIKKLQQEGYKLEELLSSDDGTRVYLFVKTPKS